MGLVVVEWHYLAQMRAQNQQDLIYKRGQAGITKASVTVVFDNSDKSTSPAGLENSKQITLTRQVVDLIHPQDPFDILTH